MSRRSRATEVLAALGVPPEAGSLQELALTHRSFAFEQQEPVPHNERLEFLGDSVLGIIVTDLIYRSRPELAEGDMARLRASLVSATALASLASSVGLGRHIRLGKGEESSGGRAKQSVLADTLEAVIGAAYLTQGLARLHEVLSPIFEDLLERVEASGVFYDPKTALQETVVHEYGLRPEYRIASSGPDHEKNFTAHVYVSDELFGVGSGSSKKEAEQRAAREALAHIEGDGDKLRTLIPVDEGGPDAGSA